MTELPTFAIVELNSQPPILPNLFAIEQGIQQAVTLGASLVVLPENAFCFGQQAYAGRYFEPLKDWCAMAARHYGIYLLAGTLPCPYRPDGTPVPAGKFRQSSLLFDPAGDCLARYDKIHLFKATVNDSTGSYDESRTFEAGNQLVVAPTEFGNIGMMVCFDVRFAPLAIALRQLGAQILTVPAAFTFQTGKAHWQALLRARALDSQCMVVGAGQTGKHHIVRGNQTSHRMTWGHSQFVNANGEVISKDPTADTLPASSWAAKPLADQARHWVVSENEPVLVTDPSSPSYRVISTQFDQVAQQQWRQNIALMDCQKLTITHPFTR